MPRDSPVISSGACLCSSTASTAISPATRSVIHQFPPGSWDHCCSRHWIHLLWSRRHFTRFRGFGRESVAILSEGQDRRCSMVLGIRKLDHQRLWLSGGGILLLLVRILIDKASDRRAIESSNHIIVFSILIVLWVFLMMISPFSSLLSKFLLLESRPQFS